MGLGFLRPYAVPFLTAVFSLFSASCLLETRVPRDYWSEVIAPCGYLIPRSRTTYGSSLTLACRAALEEALPFHESFDGAPAGLRDQVMEGFQVMAAYPIAFPPENRIFGVAPYAIPLATLCLLDPGSFVSECRIEEDYEEYLHGIPSGDPRRISRNVFNRALNRIDEIRYEPGDGTASASMGPFPTEEGISYRLTIFDAFRDTPFERSATLVHESRHGDGYHHNVNYCAAGTADCDPQLAGCYGTEAIYRLMLLHGSYGLKVEGTNDWAMTNYDVLSLGYASCLNLMNNLEAGRYPPELEAFLKETPCYTLTAQDILDLEGIDNAFD